MTIREYIRRKVDGAGLNQTTNPNDERLTFISSDEEVLAQKVRENRVWYVGSADELQNHYTDQMAFGLAKNPIYNRNKAQFFWSISSVEGGIKKVHSGLPKAIVDTLSANIGEYALDCKDGKAKDDIRALMESNRLNVLVNQQQLPLTLVEGWGAFKVDLDPSLSRLPIITYYSAENVEFLYDRGVLVGIIYETYYHEGKDDYVMCETRYRKNGRSYIDYDLFLQKERGEAEWVDYRKNPHFASFKPQDIAYDGILGVKSSFFFDPNYPDYGRSIYDGKITLFDDLDQILSQDSQTVRVSTPVEYFPTDLLERSPNSGKAMLPNVYNRQYVAVESVPSGDGTSDSRIQTTQPQLNFSQYSLDAREKINMILIGIESPASLGFDLSKRDNALAQREKERITMLTRNNVIASQQRILKELIKVALAMWGKKYDDDFSIRYQEFDSPSINAKMDYLVNAWTNGAISTEKYVDLLWADKLTEEQKEEEVERIEERRLDGLLPMDGYEEEYGAHSVL